jgi:hypothetical protein
MRGLIALILAVTMLGAREAFDAERQSEPPHAAPPAAEVTGPLPLAATGADHDEAAAQAVAASIAAITEEQAHDAMAETRQVAAARIAPARAGQACDGIAWVVPVEIVWRESRCDFGAVSPGGQYLGAYQFDWRHWDESSGWGGCADVGDWQDPDAQHECARRLSRDGTYLAPWGA